MGILQELESTHTHWAWLVQSSELTEPLSVFYNKLKLEYQQLFAVAKNPQELSIGFTKQLLPLFFEPEFLASLDPLFEKLYKKYFELEALGIEPVGLRPWVELCQKHREIGHYQKMALGFAEFMQFLFKAEKALANQAQLHTAASVFGHLLSAPPAGQGLALLGLNDEAKLAALPLEEAKPATLLAKGHKPLIGEALVEIFHWFKGFATFLKGPMDFSLILQETKGGQARLLFAFPQEVAELLPKVALLVEKSQHDPLALTTFLGDFYLATLARKLTKKDVVTWQKSLTKILETWPANRSMQCTRLIGWETLLAAKEPGVWQKTTVGEHMSDPAQAVLFNNLPSNGQIDSTSNQVPEPMTNQEPKHLKALDVSRREHIGFLTER